MAILDDNGVPILALSNSTKEFVQGQHDKARDPDDETPDLLGHMLVLENKRPVGAADTPDVTVFRVGAETLDEAAKSVVGVFDSVHGHDKPGWVASSDENLAKVVAEHYAATVIPLDQVSAAQTRIQVAAADDAPATDNQEGPTT